MVTKPSKSPPPLVKNKPHRHVWPISPSPSQNRSVPYATCPPTHPNCPNYPLFPFIYPPSSLVGNPTLPSPPRDHIPSSFLTTNLHPFRFSLISPFSLKFLPDTQSSIATNPPMKSDSSTKSKLKRLFERQFPKFSSASAVAAVGGDAEQSSVCLDKLVVGFIEESNEKPSARCGRRRCNCFNGNCDDSSDDESGDSSAVPQPNIADAAELLKGLVPCARVEERNLLADTLKIIENNRSKIGKGKENCVKVVTESLRNLGYDAAICKSRWDKTTSIPAGEYEYIDVAINSDRFIIDVDFKSEFEIARSTKNYRSILQSIPVIFVGKSDRIEKILNIISEAAKQSLKKKGLSFPPWRKLEYMKSKWLAPYERLTAFKTGCAVKSAPVAFSAVNFNGEFEIRGVESAPEKITVLVSPWTPPAVKPKSVSAGAKVVTGLSLVLTEKSTPSFKF